ncbi:protein REVEILLE 6-like [Curcuma longa]|uniref:protein REVEILLE 6-like n=1 Tax=Curcuma longa TaxID=136217 RepID=UPI003D9E7970
MMLAKASANEARGGREATAGLYCIDRCSPMSLSGGEAPSSEDLGKKTRKPYTITKSRQSWTEQDHDKFLEALQLFDRDWKKIEAFVGSKTVIQIRSHAQKYFLKVQKNGTNEHLPPPRPKRKATHPYPQKSANNVHQIPEAKILFCESCLLESDHSSTRESSSIRRNHTEMAFTSLPHNTIQPANLTKDGIVNAGVLVENNSDRSVKRSRAWSACDITDKENLVTSLHVMPDFAQVYSFLGSVFDPNTSGHLQRLKMMDPIDVETVLILMQNLAFNLTSPEFEDLRRLFSVYGGDMNEAEA